MNQGRLAMIDGINAATPVPNALPDADNSNNDVQKAQEEVSNVQTEETDRMESAQRDNEANAKPPEAQNETSGTILDILG